MIRQALAGAALVAALAAPAHADDEPHRQWWIILWDKNECAPSKGYPQQWLDLVRGQPRYFMGEPKITIKRNEATGAVEMVWIDTMRTSGALSTEVFTTTPAMCEDVRKDMLAIGRIVKPEDLR